MPKPKYPECRFCHRKFHPKGVRNHELHCNQRERETVTTNLTALSPRSRLMKSVDEFWEQADAHLKLRACAFILFSSDRGLQ